MPILNFYEADVPMAKIMSYENSKNAKCTCEANLSDLIMCKHPSHHPFHNIIMKMSNIHIITRYLVSFPYRCTHAHVRDTTLLFVPYNKF